MAKFVFRLEPVLMVRALREEAAQLELAAVEQTRLAAQRRLAGTRRKLAESLRAPRKPREPRIDVLSHHHLERYRETLAVREAAQEAELADRSRAVEEKREHLIEAVKEKRVLERLREKQEFEFRSRESARLTKELDETGLMTFRFQNMVKGGE